MRVNYPIYLFYFRGWQRTEWHQLGHRTFLLCNKLFVWLFQHILFFLLIRWISSSADRSFVVGNARSDTNSVIFVNEGFCSMSGFSRAEIMQQSCLCSFLHGPATAATAVQTLTTAISHLEEALVDLLFYRKDGQFNCSIFVRWFPFSRIVFLQLLFNSKDG